MLKINSIPTVFKYCVSFADVFVGSGNYKTIKDIQRRVQKNAFIGVSYVISRTTNFLE